MKRIVLFSLGFLFCSLVLVPQTNADALLDIISRAMDYDVAYQQPDVPYIDDPIAEDKTMLIFTAFVTFLLFVSGVGATIMIVVAGIRMMISTGDETQLETAKKTLLFAVIGLFIVILSYMIVQNIVVRVFYGD